MADDVDNGPPLAGPARPLRVLVASHSHPEVSNGGAEIAAYELYCGLRARDDCEAWFLGCDRASERDARGAVLAQPYGPREFIYNTGEFDWFKFANRDMWFPAEISRLFAELAPDVVHFHHYINYGVEVFQHLKTAVPNCRIVLTLHEYLAICNHFGQMVATEHMTLCYQSSPARCHRCFPDAGKSEFFLRKRYIERFFGLVDAFIAPSRFLADRYAAWGVPEDKLYVLENVTAATGAVWQPVPLPSGNVLRIGFFGQISGLKGIDVMFDAAEELAAQEATGISLEIFGDYRGQPPEFQKQFLARLTKAGRNIRFHGPYDRERVDQLMQSVHAVLVPSIWWENSPVVIQEALRNRRPVICSDIGGMAEKVRHGIDGLHFPAGSAMALAALLQDLAADRSRLDSIALRMSGTAAVQADLEDFVDLYRRTALDDF